MMGSGKSTIGKLLAAELHYDLVDIDAIIEEHAGMSVSDLFELHGEETFRRLESAVLADTANRIELVFATGGGILENPRNCELIMNTGLVVWLKAEVKQLAARVGTATNRPMLHGYDLEDRLSELLKSRSAAYQQAHLILNVGELSPREIVQQIVQYYRNWLTLDEN